MSSESLEALAVLDTARAIAVALVRDGVRYDARLELALREAIERWGRLIVDGERTVKVTDEDTAWLTERAAYYDVSVDEMRAFIEGDDDAECPVGPPSDAEFPGSLYRRCGDPACPNGFAYRTPFPAVDHYHYAGPSPDAGSL